MASDETDRIEEVLAYPEESERDPAGPANTAESDDGDGAVGTGASSRIDGLACPLSRGDAAAPRGAGGLARLDERRVPTGPAGQGSLAETVAPDGSGVPSRQTGLDGSEV